MSGFVLQRLLQAVVIMAVMSVIVPSKYRGRPSLEVTSREFSMTTMTRPERVRS